MSKEATGEAPPSKGDTPVASQSFPNPGSHAEFYEMFKREADEYDREFIKKYSDDMTTTLIFAGFFSVVTTIFIVTVQGQLQPDYTQMSFALLSVIADASLGNIPSTTDTALPQWTGPDPTIVRVQAILLSSLAISLLAAFTAVLGMQWINRYSRAGIGGSVVDRGRHRQHKMGGMDTWHFDIVMESLPVMPQVSLLLLGYALSEYFFSINKAAAGAVIGFTAFGMLFYLFTVSASVLSYNCPFQTPLSTLLRSNKTYLERYRKKFGGTLAPEEKLSSPEFGGPRTSGGPDTSSGNNVGNHIELAVVDAPGLNRPLFNQRVDWPGFVLDSNCVAWMFKMSMGESVILALMKFIPEIVWHGCIRTVPWEIVYDTLLECFDLSSGRLTVIPNLRERAYLSARAFLHLAIQRKCIGDAADEAVFNSISGRHQIVGSEHYEGDSDLESTLWIVDRVFGYADPMNWKNVSFTTPHHAWMGHILLYRAWDSFRTGGALPDDAKEFVLHSLRLDPLPPAPIVTDCLFMVGLVLGIEVHVDDLSVTDKSRELNPQIDRIYERLNGTFKNSNPTPDEIGRALEAMELVAPLSTKEIAAKSYELFHVIMQAPVSPAYTQAKKWDASRLALHGAYKWDKFLPWVEDPQDILTFLDYHFDLATRLGQDHDEPIQNALRALAYASNDVTIKALQRFDPTEPSFVRGICYAHQSAKSFPLRKAALFCLPLIGDKWFNTPDPIMTPDEMKGLCADWASAVDGIEHTHEVQAAALTVLFGMINSPHWRPHVATEKWKLLEYFASVPEDSHPLRRCLDNPELIEAISGVENPAAMLLWLTILWLKYKELVPEVREQLEVVTKEIAQSRSADLSMYVSVMDVEVKKAKEMLEKHRAWSTDPEAIALRKKIDNIQQAKDALLALKSG